MLILVFGWKRNQCSVKTEYIKDGIYRILYFLYKEKTFILLHGFVKKTDKTPPGDAINIAEKRMKEIISKA